MGDSDLSAGGSPPAGPVSLPDLIRAGDAHAFAGFRDSHMGMVRAYCEVACAPVLVTGACEAAFLDFVGRMSTGDQSFEAAPSLEAVLLAATRSAAASRFAAPAIEATPRGRRHPTPSTQTRVCAAMPELLAARANGEFRGDERAVTDHVAGCMLCAATEARLRAAEAAFSTAAVRRAGTAEGAT
ncbi:MAG: hypothetical protein M3Z06_12735 [Actinomycetota bacterium]|nr:hypothetical protein [Actinomycetota bacterium]